MHFCLGFITYCPPGRKNNKLSLGETQTIVYDAVKNAISDCEGILSVSMAKIKTLLKGSNSDNVSLEPRVIKKKKTNKQKQNQQGGAELEYSEAGESKQLRQGLKI